MHAGALAGAEKAHSRSTTIDFKIQRALEENKRKKQKRVSGGRGGGVCSFGGLWCPCFATGVVKGNGDGWLRAQDRWSLP